MRQNGRTLQVLILNFGYLKLESRYLI